MVPSLHHESVVAATGAEMWLYVAHGIFGAGRNWGTVARRLTEIRPDWSVMLLDLRLHGASRGFAPPHTVATSADDIVRLAVDSGAAPTALLGHSFGGKVMLAASARLDRLHQVWVVDSTPSARPRGGAAALMLDAVRALPSTFPDRDGLVDALVAQGFDPFVARWMSTNLERSDGAFRWRFDLEAVGALLDDFFEEDLWAVISAGRPDLELHFIRATRSEVLTADDVARIDRELAHTSVVHDVEGGHWLNADNPDALVDLLAEELPRHPV